MPPAYTAEQIAKGQTTTGPRPVATGDRRVVNVEPPSNSYRTYQPSAFLRISVPANWDAVDASAGSVTYAPDGGFIQGDDSGGSAFTHGVQFDGGPATEGAWNTTNVYTYTDGRWRIVHSHFARQTATP
jgi:hypothetical protein